MDTAWDLGIHDYTAVWFFQQVGREVRAIDYYETGGVGLSSVVREGLASKPYVYGTHHLPHDVMVRELGTGKSRVEMLQGLGFATRVLGAAPVEDGIETVRRYLPRCWIDERRCAAGLEALRAYRARTDETGGGMAPGRSAGAPARIQARTTATSRGDSFRALSGGISPCAIRSNKRLASGSDGSTAGPLSPPRSIPETVRRSSPALGESPPWQLTHWVARIGQMSRSKPGGRSCPAPRTLQANERPHSRDNASRRAGAPFIVSVRWREIHGDISRRSRPSITQARA